MAEIKSTKRSPRFIDLTGKRLGQWTVIGEAVGHCHRKVYWNCVCECGTQAKVLSENLRTSLSRSCKHCSAKTHGMSDSPEYQSWRCMKARCYNQNYPGYNFWGGKGITVCKRWRDSFLAFLEDMGSKPSPKHSIHRIDGDSGYEKPNCRWATPLEQAQNTSRTMLLTLGTETRCLREWARRLSTSHSTLRGRLKRGWSIDRTLTEPVRT